MSELIDEEVDNAENSDAKLLTSEIKGLGKYTSLLCTAEIGDVNRFKKTNLNWSARKLTDYLKTKKEIEILNKKSISFKLKDSVYQTKIS